MPETRSRVTDQDKKQEKLLRQLNKLGEILKLKQAEREELMYEKSVLRSQFINSPSKEQSLALVEQLRQLDARIDGLNQEIKELSNHEIRLTLELMGPFGPH